MKPSPPLPSRFPALEKGIAAVGVAVILGLATVYLFLAWPALDDFCRGSFDPRIAGPLQQVAAFYLHWTGRWAATGLHAFLTTHLDLEGPAFTLVLALMAAAWVAAFVLAADLLLGRGASRAASLGLGVLMFAIFWAGSPSPGEALYWYSGALDYGLPFLLMMVAIRLLPGLDGAGRAVAAGMLGFLVAGFHELAGGLVAAAALAQAVFAWHAGRKRLAGLSALVLLLVALGLLLNLAAPGNAARAAQMPLGGGLRRALALTLKPGETPLAWLLDLRLLALGLFLLSFPGFRALRPEWTGVKLPWLLLLPASTLAILLGGWFMTAYAVGFAPPERVQAFLYALVTIGWVATLAAAAARFDLRPAGSARGQVFALAGAAALTLSLIAAPTTLAAARGLPPALGDWRRQNAEREASLAAQRAAGRRNLVLPEVAPPPRPLVDSEITDDPTWWVNVCAARTRGVETLRAERIAGPAPRRLWRGEH
jgi:hypothetical protein